ncbi:MAG: hypothetical protein KIS67_22350 [Verrucomicrobiae bacterium]|nr:hypothetical protein [Verrucomicrobiae bacterium]
MKTRWHLVGVSGLIACIAILLYFLLFGIPFRDEESRRQVISLYDHLAVGMTAADVETNFTHVDFFSLKLRKVSETNWVIQSPMEIGARNWDLWLQFESNKLIAVKVRLADSKERRPSAAPIDKFLSH